MINQVYRLVSPRQFEIAYKERSLSNHVIVRPTHLSICAADQRYYSGKRNKATLEKKLPMALIHEGIGKVVHDPKGILKVGTRVVMIPNTPTEKDEIIGENYLRSSKFRSSGYDGFMQDYVFLRHDRLVPLFDELDSNIASFIELMTISMHAISRFEAKAHTRRQTIGVWGDGNLGFITTLFLKYLYPNTKVIVFGKNDYKLDHFSFANEVYNIDTIPEHVTIDHAFECVGGLGSQSAINQIIDLIKPEGTILPLGVSEYPVELNTRMILEKGLTMIGSSRSGYDDFVKTVNFLKNNLEVLDYLQTLIASVNSIKCIQDITDSFEMDLTTSWGKTVINWNI
ncbi:ribitol-5-phosphate dehydrogenase [Terrilactibacillus laevilacticus]|uniref:ribitol-5-phosphate dehydrogenase n=1 Tax=Terrilactibacillus laevilacticus TaxID=1380157 RepID=UPI0011475190|nr:ribitol-5-phosphate dehydrogenase [Terrilactibacillus laevilacticus]